MHSPPARVLGLVCLVADQYMAFARSVHGFVWSAMTPHRLSAVVGGASSE